MQLKLNKQLLMRKDHKISPSKTQHAKLFSIIFNARLTIINNVHILRLVFICRLHSLTLLVILFILKNSLFYLLLFYFSSLYFTCVAHISCNDTATK